MQWAEYAEYADAARGLAEIRAREAERRAHVAERTTGGRSAVDQLRQRLAAQRDYLTGLARRLGEPSPSFDGGGRSGITDVDDALRRAWEAVENADAEARRAEERGGQPALLPGLSTTGRNVLVYSAATLVAWLASCGLYLVTPQQGTASVGPLAWSLCGLPALAFFGGYLTLALVGRPKLQTGVKPNYSVGLGGLICFGGTSSIDANRRPGRPARGHSRPGWCEPGVGSWPEGSVSRFADQGDGLRRT